MQSTYSFKKFGLGASRSLLTSATVGIEIPELGAELITDCLAATAEEEYEL